MFPFSTACSNSSLGIANSSVDSIPQGVRIHAHKLIRGRYLFLIFNFRKILKLYSGCDVFLDGCIYADGRCITIMPRLGVAFFYDSGSRGKQSEQCTRLNQPLVFYPDQSTTTPPGGFHAT